MNAPFSITAPLANVESEQALLGAILIHPDVIAMVEAIVVASDFRNRGTVIYSQNSLNAK